MASVAQENTRPEMFVRRILHRLGYRYALHRRDLPGRPDIVLAPRRKVVFVHGCFWHGHVCRKGRLPTSRVDYWREKISKNRARDASNASDLRADGWDVCIVWECETSDPESLTCHHRRLGDIVGELTYRWGSAVPYVDIEENQDMLPDASSVWPDLVLRRLDRCQR